MPPLVVHCAASTLPVRIRIVPVDAFLETQQLFQFTGTKAVDPFLIEVRLRWLCRLFRMASC
jgi:hypothetical protein